MDNRSVLMNEALNLFAARGFDAVGVQEIVDAAGITKPTLYHYFGSKRGLLESILSERFQGLFHNLEKEAVYHGDLTTTLRAITSVYFQFAQTERSFYRMQLSMWFAPLESEAHRCIEQSGKRQHEILAELFIQAAQDHGNMRGRQQAYAATFLGMLNTYIGLALNGFLILDNRLAHQAIHQYMHGIFS